MSDLVKMSDIINIYNTYDSEEAREQVMKLPSINAAIIPENATNGDMIKALFNYEIVDDFHYSYVIDIENNGYYVQFDKEWWNAPYKKGENNE